LLRFVAYKAEEAGRETIAVNPRHTSQTCAACGHVDARNRDATAFRCCRCGHVAHADVNAARNILRAGLAQRHARKADQRAA
jgi:putative transposase